MVKFTCAMPVIILPFFSSDLFRYLVSRIIIPIAAVEGQNVNKMIVRMTVMSEEESRCRHLAGSDRIRNPEMHVMRTHQSQGGIWIQGGKILAKDAQ